jgi:hypothetical protein
MLALLQQQASVLRLTCTRYTAYHMHTAHYHSIKKLKLTSAHVILRALAWCDYVHAYI